MRFKGDKYSRPVFKKDQPDDSNKFRPLPNPSGSYPYHLSLNEVLPGVNENKMTFHMVGDTGSIGSLEHERKVAEAMTQQYEQAGEKDRVDFLYHLGDVVYNFGEASKYYEQFFSPFRNYHAPIFAVAGNHDSDVNAASPVVYGTLEPFMKVFCDTERRPVEFSGDTRRLSMTQPNVYWTLETPLATIIGLHSNVPKFGVITAEQRNWFVEELKLANLQRPHKAVIVCVHHAPYSADINHGSSKPVIEMLEGVFAETGIKPDCVFSGHVHNYQRFEKRYDDGKTVTYIVAGAGGYDQLHDIASKQDERFTDRSPLFENVNLLNYCDHKYGFLKLTIEKRVSGLQLSGEYYSIPNEATPGNVDTIVTDEFSIVI